jgi:hypothetical protein
MKDLFINKQNDKFMKTLRFLLLSLVAGLGMMGAKAQIGYQISLLNTATGEPRANETVTVTVSLSNNASEVFYSETKQATTNDFGVLSLSIGNADTFKDVDLNKMPFFIEVTANGVMIGKSQMLSVPVAEVAKNIVPIDQSLIVGEWSCERTGTKPLFSGDYYTFKNDGTVLFKNIERYPGSNEEYTTIAELRYFIVGNIVQLYDFNRITSIIHASPHYSFIYHNGKLYASTGYVVLSK